MNPDHSYDKPFKTYEEMIKIMESRNIIIEDKHFAEMALRNFSYYGLINGYKNTFLQFDKSDSFVEGTRFEELYTLHLIDINLNNILFKYILYLEKALKSRISYQIAEQYGVFTDFNNKASKNPKDYLDKTHYSNSTNKRSDILWKLKNCVSTDRHNLSIEHYIQDKNHIPPWILTTNISYGLAIEWYGILRFQDKEAICDTFIPPGLISSNEAKEFLKKALNLTKEYRNKIAHGSRTFNIKNLPILPKESLLPLSFNAVSEKEYNQRIGQNDILSVFLIVIILLNDSYILTSFVKECWEVFAPYQNVKFTNKTLYDIFKLPNDTFERLKRLMELKFT